MKIEKIEIDLTARDVSGNPKPEITVLVDGAWWFLGDFLGHIEELTEGTDEG